MLPSILELRFSNCGLANIHVSDHMYVNSTSVQHLDLSSSSFLGNFPQLLSNMTLLTVLDLSNNSFSSSLPVFWGKLENLVHLNLAEKFLSRIEGGLSMLVKWLYLWSNLFN